jgi:hypothetical protein
MLTMSTQYIINWTDQSLNPHTNAQFIEISQIIHIHELFTCFSNKSTSSDRHYNKGM